MVDSAGGLHLAASPDRQVERFEHELERLSVRTLQPRQRRL
jgi:hypothetical protein